MERLTEVQWTIPIWMLRGNPQTVHNQRTNPSTILDETTPPPLRYRCRHCQTPIAFVSDEIPVSDLGSHSIQVNPNGFVHEVITVRCTQSTRSLGNPIPADSWFPGYCWRYLVCDGCTEFVGWSYSRPMEIHMTFAGLSRAAVTQDQSED